MLKKYASKAGFILSLLIILNAVEINAEEKQQSFSTILMKGIIDRPIYSFLERTSLADDNSQISKIGIGFDGETYVGESNGMDYTHNKQYFRIQFLTLSGVYKQYENIADRADRYANFNLLKVNFMDETFGGVVIGFYTNIFEIKTTWYSNNDIDWAKAGMRLGYDFMESQKDLIIAPTVNVNFGIETFKADSLTCPDVKKEFMDYKLMWLEAGLNLKIAYKSLSIDLYTRVSGAKDFSILTQGGEVGFTLWKDRNPEKSKTSKSNYSINVLKLILSYNSEEFDIMNDKSDSIYNVGYKTLRMGLSAKLGKIEFFEE